MTWWEGYELDPSVLAAADQVAAISENFLDQLLADVAAARVEHEEYPPVGVLASEMYHTVLSDGDAALMPVLGALGAALVRLARQGAGEDLPYQDLADLDFEGDEEDDS